MKENHMVAHKPPRGTAHPKGKAMELRREHYKIFKKMKQWRTTWLEPLQHTCTGAGPKGVHPGPSTSPMGSSVHTGQGRGEAALRARHADHPRSHGQLAHRGQHRQPRTQHVCVLPATADHHAMGHGTHRANCWWGGREGHE